MDATDEELQTAVLDYFIQKYRENPSVQHGSGEVAVAVHNANPSFALNRLEATVTLLHDFGKLAKRTMPRGDVYYRLSGEAVNEISPSRYAQHPISPVTINNYGVFVNGANYGQINQNTKEAFEIIDKMVSAISTAEVENTKKMELIANAETIRAQLMNPTPDTSIITKSWNILNGATQFGAALVTLSPLAIELANKMSHIVTLIH